MSGTHDVISAFLDDEPFDARELADALGDPAARELLIELVALRDLVQTDGRHARTPMYGLLSMPPTLRAIAAVAAVLVALVGGYVAGGHRRDVVSAAAPPATRVVQPSGGWQDVRLGRMR
jgi:hypothetical protein